MLCPSQEFGLSCLIIYGIFHNNLFNKRQINNTHVTGMQIQQVLHMHDMQKSLVRNIKQQPDCVGKIRQLYRRKKSEEEGAVLTNPTEIFNLLESSYMLQLLQQDLYQYYVLKQQIYVGILRMLPINLQILYEEAYVLTLRHARLTFTSYLIEDIKMVYHHTLNHDQQLQMNNPPDVIDQKRKVLIEFRETALKVFYKVCQTCVLKYSQIRRVSKALTDHYYSSTLTLPLIQTCFRMLEAALQPRDISPHLCLRGKGDQLKVVFKSSKWVFNKGMTLFLWFTPHTRLPFQLLSLASENHSFALSVREGYVGVSIPSPQVQSDDFLKVVQLPENYPLLLAFQLQPSTLFKPASFRIILNSTSYAVPCPHFALEQFVTQFDVCRDMVGTIWSVMLCGREEGAAYEQLKTVHPYGLFKEDIVWTTIDKNIVKKQSIVGVFNGQRVCEGVLLNYISKSSRICFEASISNSKSHPQHEIEVFLPFLYLMAVYKQTNLATEEYTKLFDMIFLRTLKTLCDDRYREMLALYLLYFLQIAEYPISASSMQYLGQSTSFYLDIVNGFRRCEQNINIDYEEKMNLLCYLQSEWEEEWQRSQMNWWEPSFLVPQIDGPYHPSPPITKPMVKWHLRQFIGNDYCRCFLYPTFQLPILLRKYKVDPSYSLKTQLHYFRPHTTLTIEKVSNRKIDRIRKIFAKGLLQEKVQQSAFKQMESECLLVRALGVVLGVVRVHKYHLTFNSRHHTQQYDHLSTKSFANNCTLREVIRMKDVRWAVRKRFSGKPHAFLLRTKDGRDVCLYFHLGNSMQFAAAMEGVPFKKAFIYSEEPKLWIDRMLTNYEYLLWLNYISGRNYSDLTQYPVLPWTYVADQAQNDKYRNLHLNMGSLGDESRKNHFMEKFNAKNEGELFDEYHFGTHYSSSAIIMNYLIRVEPYTTGALTLQSGKFDCADRIFASYLGSYINATTSPTDVRELIPQIYILPEMFLNINHCQFGETQLNNRIDRVKLPEWAQEDPYKFVCTMRKALQNEAVSANIHHWIDLIYGFKQRGKDAVDAMNIFYPLTYEDAIDLSQVTDPQEKISFQTQIAHFGQHPAQIIGTNAHPLRRKFSLNTTLVTTKQCKIQRCALTLIKQQTPNIFRSAFQSSNSILSIKFITQQSFLVLRKHQYLIFDIKGQFLSKQHQIAYEIQSCQVSIDYKQLTTHFPSVIVLNQLLLVGGFYNGHLQLLYLTTPQYNKAVKLALSTVTALAVNEMDALVYAGDSSGELHVYEVQSQSNSIKLHLVCALRPHQKKINCISYSNKANAFATCSDDGEIRLYSAYPAEGQNCALLKIMRHPMKLSVIYACISCTPLYSVLFYSDADTTLYSYAVNGQFLECVVEKTGFIYGFTLLGDALVYLNAQREIYMDQMPYITFIKKLKLRKDKFRISCFECGGKTAIAGIEDGGLQIISCVI